MQFALRVLRMAEAMPSSRGAENAAKQVIRSASSVAANYRAAQRGRSKKDFSNKIGVVLEEADECGFWLEYIERAGWIEAELLKNRRAEAHELTCIFATIRKSSRD